jgi:hypothetical protein
VCKVTPLMRETAELDRLLTQVNCRITSIVRRRDAGAISVREAEQELKQGTAIRAELMRQIDGQEFAFDA